MRLSAAVPEPGLTSMETSAVHTNMTNTRLTDPEVLEWRFPVLVEEFCIRRGSAAEGCIEAVTV